MEGLEVNDVNLGYIRGECTYKEVGGAWSKGHLEACLVEGCIRYLGIDQVVILVLWRKGASVKSQGAKIKGSCLRKEEARFENSLIIEERSEKKSDIGTHQ